MRYREVLDQLFVFWREAQRRHAVQIAATALCIVYGLALTLNIHPVGDGLWFWYATLLREGHKPYAELHLPLQPLFVLLTAWMQVLLGKGWVASKAIAAVQVIVFCVGLFKVERFVAWKDWQKALCILAIFGMSLGASYARFDDYHVTGYCFEIYSIFLLLRLEERWALWTAPVLGILSGLSLANRINDGAALFVGVGCSLFLFAATRRRLVSVLLFGGSALLTLLAVVRLTGDSFRDWSSYTIFKAAAIKGGTESVFTSSVGFPRRMFTELHHNFYFRWELVSVLVLIGSFILVQSFVRHPHRRFRGFAISTWLLVFGVVLALEFWRLRSGEPLESIATVSVLISFGLGIWAGARLIRLAVIRKPAGWSPRESLLLIALLQIIAGSMTSGQSILEVFGGTAMLLLVLPLALPVRVWGSRQRAAFVAVAFCVASSALISKAMRPYHWHHFNDTKLFSDRVWYRHPVYGSMYIEKEQLSFVSDICKTVQRTGEPQGLLSITNPYPNYFCNVPPWHNYVQTWYDTATKETIDALVAELKAAPPEWIVYQRAEDTMAAHEAVFRHGRLLPHRALDRLILDRIAEGKWQAADLRQFQGAEWFVIRTTPPSQPPPLQ